MVVREPSFYVENVVRSDEHKFLSDLSRDPNAAGAIIWRDAFVDHTEGVSELLNNGMPLVFVDSPPPAGLKADHVGTANVAAAKRCVKQLLGLGHRRIVCVADTNALPANCDRVRGYSRAMQQAGLPERCIIPQAGSCDDRWNDRLGGVYADALDKDSFYSDLAHRIVMAILGMDPLPTALFVTYDILACWVWAVLEGKGVRIPEQMSVMGFDWRAKWDSALVDELATAAQDFEGFGRHAVELMLDRIAGEAPDWPRVVLLDAPLVVRSSIASPPQHPLEADLVATAKELTSMP
jgi:LacI family transcriptional regulator